MTPRRGRNSWANSEFALLKRGLKPVREWVERTLSAVDLPSDPLARFIRRMDGSIEPAGRFADDVHHEASMSMKVGDIDIGVTHLAAERHGEESEPHYAARVAWLLHSIDTLIRQDERELAIYDVFSLGDLLGEMDTVLSVKEDRVKRTYRAGKASGARRGQDAADHRTDARRRAKLIWRRNPSLSARRVAELIQADIADEDERPPAIRTIRGYIADLKPKKS